MTLKRTQVVMLPTNEKAPEGTIYLQNGKLRISFGGITNAINQNEGKGIVKHQHLYFLSDESIKKGDWCIMLDDLGNVFSNPQQWLGNGVLNKGHKKIIATTDKSLKDKSRLGNTFEFLDGIILPQPSQSFIEKYVKAYNEGKPIEWVDVEYDCDHNQMSNKVIDLLKINPKDNTITIRPIKDSWSREEMVSIVQSYREYAYKYGTSLKDCNVWIQENL